MAGPGGGNPKKGPSGEEEGEEGESLQRENEQESENQRKNGEPGLEI